MVDDDGGGLQIENWKLRIANRADSRGLGGEGVAAGQVADDEGFEASLGDVGGHGSAYKESLPESCNRRREKVGTLLPR